MNNYRLISYDLSFNDLCQSLVLSEYGMRHFEQAERDESVKWGHRFIGTLELIPGLGLIITMIEGLFSFFLDTLNSFPFYTEISSKTDLKFTAKSAKYHLLFPSSSDGCNGQVRVEEAELTRKQLQDRAPLGIQFKSKNIRSSIAGGFCTAASLDFLKAYFKQMKRVRIQTSLNERIFELRKIGNRIKNLQALRNRQAAFNSIEVDRTLIQSDFSFFKMQALLNYNHLHINFASREMDILKESDDQIFQTITDLPEGEFVLRLINPCDNSKLEKFGHTLIYIKKDGLHLLYDCNEGLIRFQPDEPMALYYYLKHVAKSFSGLSLAKFYRIEQT